MDLEEYRRTSHQTWAAMAPGWERWREQLAEGAGPVRRWLIRELAPRPGDTVLELSCGPGDAGFEVASTLGDEGQLISSDFASEMVDLARRRSAELGLRNVVCRLIDAERNDLETDSVDGVICQSGYMLMADPGAALGETRRVLRPGGRLALSVWGAPERNPWASIGAKVLVEQGHIAPPEPGAPGIFSMASEERTRRLLGEAGFANVRTEEVPMGFTFGGIDDYVKWVMDVAGPFAVVVRGLSEPDREAVKARLGEEFAPFEGAGGYTLPGVALTAVAS
ncbi:MAG: class I SAM-dependent methyltransferase [Myxococcota bacterium]